MSTSGTYSVHPHPNFATSYKKLKKAYAKKGGRDFDTVEADVAFALEALSHEPRLPAMFERYQFPRKAPKDGIELWRWIFDLPGVAKGSRCGRMLYAIVEERLLVCPFWIYNHDQFGKRPEDADIRKFLWDVQRGS